MEIREIEKIEPKELMSWFKKICAIPHGSYHEAALSKWIADECRKAGCEVKVFPSGMVFAKQPASKGCEDWPTVLLQSHMDMVLAKTDKSDIDLLKEPITPYYDTESGEIKADHTSLGGDDGIGVAAQLAIIHSKTIIHGPIEHLFTVCEEDHPGECIANDLPYGMLDAKYYLNIDAESLHEITHGGAGCSTMKYNCAVKQIPNKKKLKTYNVSLTGLAGGHSGNDVVRPHINAIGFLAQCIIDFGSLNKIDISISKFDGGPINNSLPIYAKMNILMEPNQFEKFKRFAINQLMLAKRVAQKQEDNAILTFEKVADAKKIYSPEDSKRILLFASLAPNKVFTQTLGENKMFSSSNLGFINIDDGKVRLDFKVRSFIDGEVQRTVRKIKSLGDLLGFKNFTQEGRLMAFINDIKQNFAAQVWGEAYKEVTGKNIKFIAVAGGLECAVLCAKNPSMVANTISINTTLFNCHSPTESFNVHDTQQFWKILKLTLSRLKD